MQKYTLHVILPLALLLAGAGCGGPETESVEAVQEKVTPVEVYTVNEAEFEDFIELPVAASPYREANLGVTGGGRIVELNVDKGDRVRKGDILLKVDDVLFKAALDQAEANLAYQKKEFSRSEKLFRDGTITEAEYDAAELQLATAKSAAEQAQKQYDDATLEAPFSGIITMRNVEVGDILTPGVSAFRLVDVSRIKVQAGVPEKYIVHFEKGRQVNIVFDALPGQNFAADIDYIAPESNTGTRTFLAEMIIRNPDGVIRAGILGNARILRSVVDRALAVPINAMVETQEGRKVFVARSDNTAEERTIEIAEANDTLVRITAGLRAGDQVITKGQHDLVNGEKIKIMSRYEDASGGGINQ